MVKGTHRNKTLILLITVVTVLAFTCLGAFSSDAFQTADAATTNLITSLTTLYPKLYIIGMILSAAVFFLSKDDKKVAAARAAMIAMTIVYAIIFFLGSDGENINATLRGLGIGS